MIREPNGVNLLERVSDAFVALDTSWRYTYVNDRAAELFGRRPEDLLGRHIWTEFPEGVGQPFHLAYEKALAEQVFIEIEAYYEPWGRWFENRIYPSPDGISIFFHEISDRKRAELAARENAALLEGQKQVLESITSGEPLKRTLDLLVRVIEERCPGVMCSIVVLGADGRQVHYGAAPSLPEPLVRALDGEPIGPRAGSCGTAVNRRETVIVEDIAVDPLWDDYRNLALAHGLRACWSFPVVDPHGRALGALTLYFRAPGRPTERHLYLIEAATHTAAIALVKEREAADRRAIEEETRRREAQLQEAQRIAQVGSYEWDIRTKVVYRSAELFRIFGVTPEEFPPTLEGYLDRVHPADRKRTGQIIGDALSARTPFNFEERIVRPDGSIRLLQSQGSWMTTDGEPVALMGVCQDITGRRLAERQLRQSEVLRARNEELKAFAYTVSHDLKAPLRGISGYAKELERRHGEALDERGRFCLDRILAATQNLNRLIDDLLQYSRLDAETPTRNFVDLSRTIDGILRESRPRILELRAELAVNLSVTSIEGWERGLRQVLANLIDNALKYSGHATPPRVRITSEAVPDGVRIRVSDNGIGFDVQHHDRIFGLFTRLVTDEEFEGTGAGLAIVKKLVDKMGGRLSVESAPGSGATFSIELPERSLAVHGESASLRGAREP